MLNATCLSADKGGNHRTTCNWKHLCNLRLQHFQNGNAAYSSQMGGDIHFWMVERSDSAYYTGVTAIHTIWWEVDSWMGVLRNTTLLLTTHWNLRPDVGILGRRRTGFFKTVWGLAHSFKVCCVLLWGSVNFVMLTVLEKYPMHQTQVVIIHKVSVNSLVHFSLLN